MIYLIRLFLLSRPRASIPFSTVEKIPFQDLDFPDREHLDPFSTVERMPFRDLDDLERYLDDPDRYLI